jgi:class 3 adenylate cyclase
VRETRYAKSDDVSIAYQVVGDGPFDLLYVPGWVSNVELAWEEPRHARFIERLASFSRLIMFDKRGTGMSDPVALSELPSLETRMDDVRAVLDAVASERAALFGVSEGGNMSVLFAATYPERTAALVTFGIFAKRLCSPDYPWAPTLEEREAVFVETERTWGNLDVGDLFPSEDEAFKEHFAAYARKSASPGAAVALLRMNTQIDVRHVLPAVHVPTLVLHRTDDRDANVEEGRWIASQIPGARFVELEGDAHLPIGGDQDSVLDEIEEFLTGDRRAPSGERVLTTVLFTDLIGSTERAAALGDRSWRALLDDHNRLVRRELERFRGREVDTAGDGFFATFDGPARAVRCALAIAQEVSDLSIEIRAGVHTGEVQTVDGKAAGIAVTLGARVAALAGPSEVLVSQTVRDLVAGSGLSFEDAGEHELKGVPETWRVYRASLVAG